MYPLIFALMSMKNPFFQKKIVNNCQNVCILGLQSKTVLVQHVLQPPIPAFFYAGWQNLREAARGFAGKLDADENLKP